MRLSDFFGRSSIRARWAARERRREECGGEHLDLTPAQVAPIFARVTRVPRAGFTEIRSGWWVRPAPAGTFRVLQFLRSSRGFDYRFRWGISLPWVPRVTGGALRWHRTLKSAVFDLWDQPPDYLIRKDTPWAHADRYFPDRSLGAACFEEDLATCWSLVASPIEEWWTGVSSPSDVLARAREQLSRDWEGAHHAPDPLVVIAFTLARLGRLEEAEERLRDIDESDAVSALQRRALARVAADAGHDPPPAAS